MDIQLGRASRSFRENALLLLSLLTGAFVTLNFAAAQARFLPHFPAAHLVYIFAGATLLVSFLMRWWNRRPRASRFSFVTSAVFLFLLVPLIFLLHLGETDPRGAYALMFLVSLFPDLFRWILVENTERHVNPALTGKQFAAQAIFYELGKIAGVGLLELGARQSWEWVAGISLALLFSQTFIVQWGLGQRHMIEHRLGPAVGQVSAGLGVDIRKLGYGLALIGILWGTARLLQESVVKEVFRQTAQGDSLENLINLSFAAEAVFALVLNSIYRHWVEGRRLSPFLVLSAALGTLMVVNVWALQSGGVFIFLLATSLNRGLGTLYFPSIARLISSFELNTRIGLQARHGLAVGLVSGLLASVILGLMIWWLHVPVTPSLLGFVSGLWFVAFVLVWILKRRISPILKELVSSSEPGVAIPAAVGLSYLRDPAFVEEMEAVLKMNPKNILRKTVLLGLGYTRRPEAVQILLEQFESDREEIQITVLEALTLASGYDATRFALEIVLSNRSAISPRVRLNAARMIASMYGRKSIPILMVGLSDEDPRQVANVLEALATFPDPALIPVFKKYSSSDFPRLRANALLGLSRFPSERGHVASQIRSSLMNPRAPDFTSILYVIGRRCDKSFAEDVNERLIEAQTGIWAAGHDPEKASLAIVLIWAGIRLRLPTATQLAWSFLENNFGNESLSSFMHFFNQLDEVERFDCIERWIALASNREAAHRILEKVLGASGYDFQDELQFLRGLRISSPQFLT